MASGVDDGPVVKVRAEGKSNLKVSTLKEGFGIVMDVGVVIDTGAEDNENLKAFSIEGALAAFGTSMFRLNVKSDELIVAVDGF